MQRERTLVVQSPGTGSGLVEPPSIRYEAAAVISPSCGGGRRLTRGSSGSRDVRTAPYRAGVDLRIEPIEFEVNYATQHEPIGRIRRRRDGFHAKLGDEYLGAYDTGDAAVEAIWNRYVEAAHAQHEAMSHIHGGFDRHRR